ncbi:hypothetical protein TRAPUB_9939 [Trametes pubescens]|uniref:F-box domain-containing protein n=1 Tax=Trametes pubescens TaxID=154538 RepID=A0A1M2W0X8_TRAPU|nr:hypothetical protein TRAPUB_9939 [Trametes pubescens]
MATISPERTQFALELLSRAALWNADLPIHSLPAEVLLHIFEQLAPALLPDKPPSQFLPYDEEAPRPWARLMLVCRHWCALIRNRARFWSDITIATNTRWFDLALSRLGTAPMRLQLTPDCDLAAVLPMLAVHAGRVEKLTLEGAVSDEDAPCLEAFLSRPLPVLTSLAITMESTAQRQARAVGHSCAGLERLELTRAPLPWTKPVLANLEILSLTECCLSTPTLPFPDFLDVLEHGQRLRYLYLNNFLSAALDPQSSAPCERVVTLPRLQHLECRDIPADIARLTAHLHTPAISYLELLGSCTDDGDVPPSVHASLLPPSPPAQFPALQRVTSAYLDVSGGQTGLHVTHPPCGISMEMYLFNLALSSQAEQQLWFERELLRLPTHLGPALTALELRGVLAGSAQAPWDRVLDAFPALQTLVVCEYTSRRLPRAMLRSLQSAVRCRALTHLRIDGWEWRGGAFRRVLECLRARAARGAARLAYFGAYADADGWEEGMRPVLEKYRTLFLGVVDVFVLDGVFDADVV